MFLNLVLLIMLQYSLWLTDITDIIKGCKIVNVKSLGQTTLYLRCPSFVAWKQKITIRLKIGLNELHYY